MWFIYAYINFQLLLLLLLLLLLYIHIALYQMINFYQRLIFVNCI
jgi:hypothetical protein